jgi:hypothetical protein
VPKFLLAGFTLNASVDDDLWTHDVIEPRERPLRQRPRTVAFETDYNRVERLDDPVAIEKSLGQQETVAPPIIRKIAETGAPRRRGLTIPGSHNCAATDVWRG